MEFSKTQYKNFTVEESVSKIKTTIVALLSLFILGPSLGWAVPACIELPGDLQADTTSCPRYKCDLSLSQKLDEIDPESFAVIIPKIQPSSSKTFAAVGSPVGDPKLCKTICDKNYHDIFNCNNLACYNMCMSGRAIGCRAWLDRCTAGNFWGFKPGNKKAIEMCMIGYNAFCQ